MHFWILCCFSQLDWYVYIGESPRKLVIAQRQCNNQECIDVASEVEGRHRIWKCCGFMTHMFVALHSAKVVVVDKQGFHWTLWHKRLCERKIAGNTLMLQSVCSCLSFTNNMESFNKSLSSSFCLNGKSRMNYMEDKRVQFTKRMVLLVCNFWCPLEFFHYPITEASTYFFFGIHFLFSAPGYMVLSWSSALLLENVCSIFTAWTCLFIVTVLHNFVQTRAFFVCYP